MDRFARGHWFAGRMRWIGGFVCGDHRVGRLQSIGRLACAHGHRLVGRTRRIDGEIGHHGNGFSVL
jgi:hypothetical protein